MQLANRFNRPEYLFRPAQIWHRLLVNFQHFNTPFQDVKLPWGVHIRVHPEECIGRSIWAIGIYELAVTETLWRLTAPGDTVVDVGANVGYMTSILAARTGLSGHVYCFEAHPDIFQELVLNISNWQQNHNWRHIHAANLALSHEAGNGLLKVPDCFQINRGMSRLVEQTPEISEKDSKKFLQITKECLDNLLPGQAIALLKLDVEGHELNVLKGSVQLLETDKIQNILFENHGGYPSHLTDYLEQFGYQILKLKTGFWKPYLVTPEQAQTTDRYWESPMYLASLDMDTALKKLSPSGWYSLAGKQI
jgi:FkbM family methyltransferase